MGIKEEAICDMCGKVHSAGEYLVVFSQNNRFKKLCFCDEECLARKLDVVKEGEWKKNKGFDLKSYLFISAIFLIIGFLVGYII